MIECMLSRNSLSNQPPWLCTSLHINFPVALSAIMLRYLQWGLLLFPLLAWSKESVNLVRVIKHENKLQLVADDRVIQEFHVVFGKHSIGHKRQEGDKKTPEGRYVLDYKKADSAFYKAIHISYPNAEDRSQAKALGVHPGGQVMLHGQKNGWSWLSFINQRFNWTNGCIALSNADMQQVWDKVAPGTAIEIMP